MKASSIMFRAGVAVEVLVLILVPLLSFCDAIPVSARRRNRELSLYIVFVQVPPGHTQGAPRAPSAHRSPSGSPPPYHHNDEIFETPDPAADSPLPRYEDGPGSMLVTAFPFEETPPTYRLVPNNNSHTNSPLPSLLIYHYIDYPDYPAGSDFQSYHLIHPDHENYPEETEKVLQLQQVREEVNEMLFIYTRQDDIKDIATEQFRAQCHGHVTGNRIIYAHRWYPSYSLEPGAEVHAKIKTKVFDEMNGRALRTEEWLVTVKQNPEGGVQGAKVKDVEGAVYPTL
ncbi:hypothetical protein F5878DRAFT_343763 [Lentinula raphanica]|uniref:Uncharacterized protein n=1 Tax=Lentinula raphanica TaxID=153919 RepID=A0AA38P1S1_9AGAR|nr:hypothetical protein F5880DRAFT_260603 [Lentinula raphanica]KAJ3834728.1 hypothetical protein F5878DRAFT_343763 [Lentinula raphanica]